MRPYQGGEGGGSMSPIWILKRLVSVFIKCLSLIVGFAVTVAIWPREVVSCRNFILRTVAIMWAMSLVRIYRGRASYILQLHLYGDCKFAILVPFNSIYSPKPSLKIILSFCTVISKFNGISKLEDSLSPDYWRSRKNRMWLTNPLLHQTMTIINI